MEMKDVVWVEDESGELWGMNSKTGEFYHGIPTMIDDDEVPEEVMAQMIEAGYKPKNK